MSDFVVFSTVQISFFIVTFCSILGIFVFLFFNGGVVGGEHEMKEMMVEVQLNGDAGNFSLLEPANGEHSGGLYDKPLSCFGCGIGWFS
jgi:hypothetical protein